MKLKSIPVIVLLLTLVACERPREHPDILLAKARAVMSTDRDAALQYAKEAAEMGYVPAQLALGNYHESDRLAEWLDMSGRAELQVDALATYWFKAAYGRLTADARYGDVVAQRLAAIMKYHGFGTIGDRELGHAMMLEAAARGDSEAYMIAAKWSISDGDLNGAKDISSLAIRRGHPVGHRIRAFVIMRRDKDRTDVVDYATSLKTAYELGDEPSGPMLDTLFRRIESSAQAGATVALASKRRLEDTGLWRIETGPAPADR